MIKIQINNIISDSFNQGNYFQYLSLMEIIVNFRFFKRSYLSYNSEKMKKMNFDDYMNRIEKMVGNINRPSSSNESEKNNSTNDSLKELVNLLITFFMDIIKFPLKIIANIIRKEIIYTLRKDAKLYALIMGLMVVLFIFFSVLWLFVSTAVGVYFYENGSSILASIMYSVLFQLGSFIILGIVVYIASGKIESLKMLKKLDSLKSNLKE